MYRFSLFALMSCIPVLAWDTASDLAARARQMERQGDSRGALQMLERAAKDAPRDAAILNVYAEALDHRRDPRARQAYAQLLEIASGEQKLAVARRLAVLDLLANDRQAVTSHVAIARTASGSDWSLPPDVATRASAQGMAELPGPLRSFNRMAALSPDLPAEDLVSALARNIITNGYQATSGSESLEPTEYLKLVMRYLSQARELDKLAGDTRVLKIETCDSNQTGQLLKVLGFRMRGACGSELVLETVNATRAFLSMDSGFPVAELEQALRTNRPFEYDYHPTKIPVLYGTEYWLSAKEKQAGEFVDLFVGDPSVCRLYLGLAKMDPTTADEVRRTMPVAKVRAFAHVFDFFGGMFRVRNGKAIVPGAPRSVNAWSELVGASPDSGIAFYEALVVKDDGWMASYFDSIARIQGPTQDYLTDPTRLRRFYTALRGRVTSPGPARPVFRANTDLMLLTTRLRMTAEGKPHVPGGLDVWKNLFTTNPNGKYDGKLTKAASGWKDSDDLLEALYGLSRKAVENEPLKIYLALSDLDRNRPKPLESATVLRLMKDYRFYGAQYSLFNEVPTVSDKTILQYMDAAAGITDISDNALKADQAGVLQALAGIWQVLCRHKLIPAAEADAALAELITPFGKGKNARDIFDAGRNGIGLFLKVTNSQANANPQDRMFELMAGVSKTDDVDTLGLLVAEMNKIFESQRLLSLKTIFDLSDHLESVSRGEKLNAALVNRLAAKVSELNIPRAALSAQEKNSLSFGYWTEKHIDVERKLNLRQVIDKAQGSPEKLKDSRGLLTPLLRDTLVGLLYVHYAPPGAQILYTNPLFVRSHDFIGIQGTRQTWKTTEVLGTGWPSSAGGRLVGSLTTLPYALAEAEQNFLIPTREQALIWGDLVPQLLVSSKVSRWWNVTPEQLRYVALNTRMGETLLAESVFSQSTRVATLDLLSRHADPLRTQKTSDALLAGDFANALRYVTPAELFLLGVEATEKKMESSGGHAAQIRQLTASHPEQFSASAISTAFGTPKPTLTNSLRPELLNLRLFPTLMGYSSRLMAESWESNHVYYATLADELGFSPSQMNTLVPEWTQKSVEQIFATHLEDWPALLFSVRTIGDQVRATERKLRGIQAASLN